MARQKGLRPTWEGHLRLSLVTCPVALYSATERNADIHFNLINPKTNNRIRMQTVDAGTGKAVDRADLVRGFDQHGFRARTSARHGRADARRPAAHHRHVARFRRQFRRRRRTRRQYP